MQPIFTRDSSPHPRNIYESPDMFGSEQTRASYFGSSDIIQSERTMSYSSDMSSTPSTPLSASARKTTSFTFLKPAATVNVHTTCGRHSEQLLFGGPSLFELARKVIRKDK